LLSVHSTQTHDGDGDVDAAFVIEKSMPAATQRPAGTPFNVDESRLPVTVLIEQAPGAALYEKYAKHDHAFQMEKKLEVTYFSILLSSFFFFAICSLKSDFSHTR
jgi:hypothetical protein